MIEKKHWEWMKRDNYFWVGFVIGAFTISLLGMLIGAAVSTHAVWVMDTAVVLAPAVAVLVIRQMQATRHRRKGEAEEPDRKETTP